MFIDACKYRFKVGVRVVSSSESPNLPSPNESNPPVSSPADFGSSWEPPWEEFCDAGRGDRGGRWGRWDRPPPAPRAPPDDPPVLPSSLSFIASREGAFRQAQHVATPQSTLQRGGSTTRSGFPLIVSTTLQGRRAPPPPEAVAPPSCSSSSPLNVFSSVASYVRAR